MKNLTKVIILAVSLWVSPMGNYAQTTFLCGTPPTSPPSSSGQPANCIDYLKDFIPYTTDPVLEVNVYFWIFSPPTGSYDPWGANTTADADYLLADLNYRYNYFQMPHLPVNNTYPWVQSAKIKFVRSGFTHIVDTAFYTIPSDPPARIAMSAPNALNLFFGDCSFDSCGIEGAAVPNTGKQYCNHIGFSAQGNTTSFTNYAFTTIHEISHALGNMSHTKVEEGYGSYIKPENGCCDSIPAEDYELEAWQAPYGISAPCNDSTASNNCVAFNRQCATYLSPQQCAIMQYNLRTYLKTILTTNSYNNHLQRNSDFDQDITSDTTWSRDHYCKGNITVKGGKTLTIQCLVGMAQNTKIIVERGGQLVIDGGKIVNISGHTWKGIEVHGYPSLDQSLTGSGGYATYQGIVRVINNGKISNAEIGVRNYKTNHVGNFVSGYNGGMVIATNANFINNVRDIEFRAITAPSMSYFSNCQFQTTGIIGSNQIPLEHVRLSGLRNIKFFGCNFEYAAGTLYSTTSHGLGIYSAGAGYSVDRLCGGSSSSCIPPTIFKNLTYGIFADNTGPVFPITVQNSRFEEMVYMGAYVHNMNTCIFDKNYFSVPTSWFGCGMYLNQNKYYNIKNNTFKQEQNLKYGAGIFVYDSKEGSHQIYRNSFEGLGAGIDAMDNNLGATNSLTGLKMNCNDFTTVSSQYDIAVVTTGGGYGVNMPSVKRIQGTTSGVTNLVRNKYSVPSCGNYNKWYVDPNSTVSITHGCNLNSFTGGVTDPSGCASSQVVVSTLASPLDYTLHCPTGSASDGGTATNPKTKLENINTYLSELRALGSSADPFELQATVASKLNYFLMDSLPESMDSVIQILTDNPGNMADADLQLVQTYISMGDFTSASSLVNTMGSDRNDWKELFEILIDIYQDPKGIYSLDSNETYISFMTELATNEGKDGQGIAKAILKFVRGVDYNVPMFLPEEEPTERYAQPTSLVGSLQESNNFIKTYPNPTTSGIKISCILEEEGVLHVKVKDLLGKEIYHTFINSKSENLIPLENYCNGVYFITVTKDKELLFKSKVIKQD